MNKLQLKKTWPALAVLLALAAPPTAPTLVGDASLRRAPSDDALLARRIILYKDGSQAGDGEPSANA